jgi:hypothetical protein
MNGKKSFDGRFWLVWIVSTTVAFTLGTVVAGLMGPSATELMKGLVFGVSLGLVQWPILRNRIAFSGVWIPIMLVVGMVGFVTGENSGYSLGGMVNSCIEAVDGSASASEVPQLIAKAVAGIAVGSLATSLITGYALAAIVRRGILKPIEAVVPESPIHSSDNGKDSR